MADQVPFLNEYKLVFFWKRFIQTLLGGPKLRLGYESPVYVYINQVVLFILPFVLGGLVTLLVELDAIQWYIGTYIYGALMALYVIIAQCISLFAQKRPQSGVSRIGTLQNVLAEEDEVEFDSCFDTETFKFIVPIKKWKINIVAHALTSGAMCGLGLWFLLPSTLHALFNNVGATIIIFIFGWFTVCVAQYPLTATGPPEPATYRTTDTFEVMPLLRAFYVLVLFSVHLTWRFHQAELLVSNQILHVIFIFLPLLWLLGILPPLDSLWVWMGEQLLVKALGGSYMASDIRLLLMLLISGLTLLVAYFLPSTIAVAVFCACMGYILSLDLSTLCNQIVNFCRKKVQKKKVKTNADTDNDNQSQLTSHIGLGWCWGWKECVLHFLMLSVIGAISGVCSHISDSIISDVNNGLGYALIGLLVVEELLQLAQGVYIFGIFRNPLFPCNVQSSAEFARRKRTLHRIGYLWRGLSNMVVPVLMLVYVSLFNTTSTLPSFLYVFGSVRAWRRIWQNSSRSLLEISIVHIINATQIGPASWRSASLGLQLMLVGFLWDCIVQFLQKLYAHVVIMITSYTVEKQRRSSTLPMIIIILVLYPFTLAVLILASVLSAPLLPLFTLPIVMVGFPRSMRFWPEPVGASANKCEDSIYYEQLAPKLTVALRRAIADGSLGSIQPGLFYLVRFQDRMAWLQLLESGYGYCTISIKGMELQETSCHTVEAAELDGIFETTFENERKFKCCSVNKYPLHTLVPVDAFPVQTYSDARNVLTGIIDSPDTLQSLDQCFLKTLIWVMLHHNSSRKRGDSTNPSPSKSKMTESPMRTNSRAGLVTHAPPIRDNTQDSGRPLSMQSAENTEETKVRWDTKSRTSWEGSLHSWGDDDDDDNDSLDLDFSSSKKKGVNLNTRTSANNSANNRTVGSSKGISALPGTIPDTDQDIDDLMDELDFGLPAMDAKLKKNANQNHIPMNTFQKPVIGIKLAGSMQFSSPHSSKLSLPLKWREIPLEPGKVNPYLSRFPKDWYVHVLKKLDLAQDPRSAEQVAMQIADDDALTNMYSYLVMACYVVTNVTNRTGGDGQPLTPHHVYKVYSGEIPWSTSLEWLNEDPELMSLVVKAFRLAFKLAFDQAVLGEASDLEELSEYLEEYESDWYFGSEKDNEWTEAVKQEKTQLFSLIHDPSEGVYKGRVLTKQPVMTYIGRLNAEVVRALWASLSLELLYFTNDDEERYSIQAHPVILRNLTIQAAEPPLGYPIYSSPPISLPTF